jgi:glycerol-3-phosphate acyltransferase PlsY
MTWLAAAVVGYLCGAIPFAYLLTRAATGEDLRTVGSGNVGATNALRRTGWWVGLTALALDAGKGAAAAGAGLWLGQRMGPLPSSAVELFGHEVVLVPAAIAGLAAVVGHVFPVWLRFAGGKGVATAAGVFAVLAPVATLGAAIAFVVVVWRTRYVSLGSITAAVLLAGLTFADDATWPVRVAACVAGGMVVVLHRENVARLRGGREHRL